MQWQRNSQIYNWKPFVFFLELANDLFCHACCHRSCPQDELCLAVVHHILQVFLSAFLTGHNRKSSHVIAKYMVLQRPAATSGSSNVWICFYIQLLFLLPVTQCHSPNHLPLMALHLIFHHFMEIQEVFLNFANASRVLGSRGSYQGFPGCCAQSRAWGPSLQ